MKKLAYAVLTTAMAGGLALSSAGAASAGHCFEGESPGFSYFGTDHVKEADHNGDEAGQPEGGRVHAGTPGASNCRNGSDSSTDPSDRAPGQGKKA